MNNESSCLPKRTQDVSIYLPSFSSLEMFAINGRALRVTGVSNDNTHMDTGPFTNF